MLNQVELEKLSKAILSEKGIKENEWKKQVIREAKEALFISENTGKGTPYYDITTLIINAEREKLVKNALTELYGKEKKPNQPTSNQQTQSHNNN